MAISRLYNMGKWHIFEKCVIMCQIAESSKMGRFVLFARHVYTENMGHFVKCAFLLILYYAYDNLRLCQRESSATRWCTFNRSGLSIKITRSIANTAPVSLRNNYRPSTGRTTSINKHIAYKSNLGRIPWREIKHKTRSRVSSVTKQPTHISYVRSNPRRNISYAPNSCGITGFRE